MGANTSYYAKVPKLVWEWVEVSALTASDVWEAHPAAMEVLHWTEYEELQDNEQ